MNKQNNTKKWKLIDKLYHENATIVDTYDARILRNYGIEYKYFSVDRWVSMFDVKKELKVLDFGCGTGNATMRLLKRGIETISIDASKMMIEKLKEKAQKEGLKTDCILGDVEKLPFSNEYFDGIFCLGVLHHIPNIQKGIQEQIRTIKKGGIIFIAEPYRHLPFLSYILSCFKSLLKKMLNLFKPAAPTTYERTLTREHVHLIQSIFEKNGCECSIEYFIYWPVICGYLPEKLAYNLIKFLNKYNFKKDKGDSVFIVAKRKE